jgi:putative protease
MEERAIGKVTHFFGRISVAVLELTEPLKVGDTIHIKGHTTDLTQQVESMQIEHQAVEEAVPGDKVAIKVKDHVREHDVIYKVISDGPFAQSQ